jgi:hypothetical protein
MSRSAASGRKPFSPLELITLIDELSEAPSELVIGRSEPDAEQLLVYARDLGRIVEVERRQRSRLTAASRPGHGFFLSRQRSRIF